MANPIVRGFSKLTQFAGRDTRGEFWPYVAAVIALTFILNAVLMSWVMSQVFADVQTYAAAHPEGVTTTVSPGSYSVSVNDGTPGAPMPNFTLFGGSMVVFILLNVGLLAAAVSRRLHDRNMTALWGLMPLPFLGIAAIGFPIMMTDMMASETPNFGLFGLLFLNNALYMVALVTLIVMLAQRSAPGPNRFGADRTTPERDSDWGAPG